MDIEKVGKFIRNIRNENNLTQKDLADRLNVTYQAVSKWETGKSLPDIDVLKKISEEFNVSIDEVLNGEIKEKTHKHLPFLYGFLIVLVIALALVFICWHHNNGNFEFKTISTSCKEFTITGSAAYNKDKTSIYISNVEFCGDNEDDVLYEKIECNLYESYENTDTLISSCGSKEKVNLTEFLKDLRINVDNYQAMCKTFSSSSVYLEIVAYTNEVESNVYKIPIELDNNC